MSSEKEINEIIDKVLDAPVGQIDEIALTQLRDIRNSTDKNRSKLTRKLIEDSSFYSLTSDFTINVFGIIHNMLIDLENEEVK